MEVIMTEVKKAKAMPRTPGWVFFQKVIEKDPDIMVEMLRAWRKKLESMSPEELEALGGR